MRPYAAAMRDLLNQPGLQVVPGCGDGLAARLVEEAGFAIGFASGSSISAMRLAMPDMDLLTFPEMRDAVETMVTAAPKVMWLADGDTGYGNAIAVQKTIRAYARAGAAAVLIEDKQWPRQLGHKGAKLVVERDEARVRCRAAVQAAREEGVLLLARTDARTSRGFEEALARLKDFVDEGADILFLDSPATEEEMRAAVEACKGKPSIAVTNPGGKHFKPKDDVLAGIGIKMVIYPQEILASTVLAVRAALQGLKTGQRAPMAEPADLAVAIRSPEYLALDARLAKGG
ncbi:MAG TPA: isocitrate lyase/PEP mutase family protein [Rhodopila sp.]|uniref:isocitrate lyase/PEP mutase family protein n=1 Tax=Rhodopila sp. TaxID=2480087 RepID=UPI002C7BE4F6|nr:isocitrate lyase/PEP mutase family protein [Rhodopila sp.]HVY16256.1 isocitrate lyase/PEP mutase family protein [Rhodopila sp.]